MWCMQEGLLKWGHPGDHVKTVHEEIFINYGLRSFGLTFRTSRFSRQVPQLAALALHTAGFTAQASQFAQSWFGLHYFTCNTIFIWLDLFNFKAKLFIFSSIVLVNLMVLNLDNLYEVYNFVKLNIFWASVPGHALCRSLCRWDHWTATGPSGRRGNLLAYYLFAPLLSCSFAVHESKRTTSFW